MLLQEFYKADMNVSLLKVIYHALSDGTVVITVVHYQGIVVVKVLVSLKPGYMGVFKIN